MKNDIRAYNNACEAIFCGISLLNALRLLVLTTSASSD